MTPSNPSLKVTKDEDVKPPAEKIQEKVAFIFNNLSQMNMQQKADELKVRPSLITFAIDPY